MYHARARITLWHETQKCSFLQNTHVAVCVCVSVRECLLFCLCVLSGAAINLNTSGSAGCLHHLVTDDMKIYSHDIYPFLNLNSHRPTHKLTCNSELIVIVSDLLLASPRNCTRTHCHLFITKSQSKKNRPNALPGFPPARSCCTTACTYVLFFFSLPHSGCSALVGLPL